ncbi:MAG TPA: hypothetical protein VF790_10245, partial [Dissulfurispiraceae bacterium]
MNGSKRAFFLQRPLLSGMARKNITLFIAISLIFFTVSLSVAAEGNPPQKTPAAVSYKDLQSLGN